MKNHIVEVLPSIAGCDSWAWRHIGEKYVVQRLPRRSYYVVMQDGKPTKSMLPVYGDKIKILATFDSTQPIPEGYEISRVPEDCIYQPDEIIR